MQFTERERRAVPATGLAASALALAALVFPARAGNNSSPDPILGAQETMLSIKQEPAKAERPYEIRHALTMAKLGEPHDAINWALRYRRESQPEINKWINFLVELDQQLQDAQVSVSIPSQRVIAEKIHPEDTWPRSAGDYENISTTTKVHWALSIAGLLLEAGDKDKAKEVLGKLQEHIKKLKKDHKPNIWQQDQITWLEKRLNGEELKLEVPDITKLPKELVDGWLCWAKQEAPNWSKWRDLFDLKRGKGASWKELVKPWAVDKSGCPFKVEGFKEDRFALWFGDERTSGIKAPDFKGAYWIGVNGMFWISEPGEYVLAARVDYNINKGAPNTSTVVRLNDAFMVDSHIMGADLATVKMLSERRLYLVPGMYSVEAIVEARSDLPQARFGMAWEVLSADGTEVKTYYFGEVPDKKILGIK